MMWINGYNDNGVEPLTSNIQDPFFSALNNEHRPLMPRPTAFGSSSAQSSFNYYPTITTTTHDHLLALNHYHLAMAENSRRGLISASSSQHVVVSSRWNPTPEQLQTLEEIYRRGTRTPSAEQIQQITAQLRRYGKIEGKNVFYWFQNHKARERLKRRRRRVESSSSDERQPPPQNNNHNLDITTGGNEESGAMIMNMASCEVEQTTKNRPLNSITAGNQKKPSAQGTTMAIECESRHGLWARQFYNMEDNAESLHHHRRNATWHAMHLPCSSSLPTNLPINYCSTATATPSEAVHRSQSTFDVITNTSNNNKKIQDSMFNNLFLEPYYANAHESLEDDDDDQTMAQTLQLFPIRCDEEESVSEEDPGSAILSNDTSTSLTNYKFFEFLPLKN